MKLFTTLIVYLVAWSSLFGQTEQETTKFHHPQTQGIYLLTGIPYYKLPEKTTYKPLLLSYDFHIPFASRKENFYFGLDLAPQFGVVMLEEQELEYEFGVNVNWSINFISSRKSIVSLNLGFSPHFITHESERQADGYIFSDNLFLRYNQKLGNKERPTYLQFFVGHRHISNASLQKPNGGIDNLMIGIGLARAKLSK